jgi:hypothetical protein
MVLSEGEMSLDVLKDLLGLLGATAMAVPFFKDFLRRMSRDRIRRLRRVFASFGKALENAEVHHTTSMEAASRWDLAFMLFGVMLLIASFAVSLCISAHH